MLVCVLGAPCSQMRDRILTARCSVVCCCAIKRGSKQFRLLIKVLVLGRRIRFSGVAFTSFLHGDGRSGHSYLGQFNGGAQY